MWVLKLRISHTQGPTYEKNTQHALCYVLGIPEICYVYVMVSDYYVMYAD